MINMSLHDLLASETSSPQMEFITDKISGLRKVYVVTYNAKDWPKGVKFWDERLREYGDGTLEVYVSREQAKREGTERVHQQLQLRLNAYNIPLTSHRERDWPRFESENERVWT